jgi:hypothetical protein
MAAETLFIGLGMNNVINLLNYAIVIDCCEWLFKP